MSSPLPFTIQPVPNRGFGVVANEKILKGTRVISEAPLLTVRRDTNSTSIIQKDIDRQLEALNSDQRSAFFSLSNAYEGNTSLNIARTNALPLGSDATHVGMFMQSARINHACNPNSQNTWNSKLHKLTIHAIRDIAKGEEITITYLDGTMNFDARHARLTKVFRFNCSCEVCSLPPNRRRESDRRRDRITLLDELIGDYESIVETPLSSIGKAYEAFVCLQVEGLSPSLLARLYYDAFQIVIAHGDQARAKVFAQRAYSERVTCEGADSTDAARLSDLVQDPASHSLYGTTRQWAPLPSDIPDKLGEQEFEHWLWRKKKWLRA